MKGNEKICKDSHFEPPFGGLKGSSMARWKARRRLIELYLLALKAVKIGVFWRVGHFGHYGPLDRGMM